MTIWIIIFGVGLIGFLLRSSALLLLRGRPLPERLASALGLVPAAVLSALVVPELFVHGGEFNLLSARMVAGVVAGGVAWKTKSVLWTLVVGLGLLVAFQALGWK
ncbi:AzlD domain-containing protein [Deinococcus psychrotolerans]|uniref:AzlD domain-containing protein n=1 Tax=Deinococcus psychrotolerans TaxID=2489213 RepID=A0A3G8YGL3_9DEIO|nr:AzlD domain-containing protein [Deinococcus psychrotolerans]AZI43327.1 AzlD domain-containing protein [Deinococcus psychrotolerans]